MKKICKLTILCITAFIYSISIFGCKIGQSETNSAQSSLSQSTTTSSALHNDTSKSIEKSSNSAIKSDSNGNSASTGGSNDNIQDTDVNLTIGEKTDRLLNGATINDRSFIEYYKSSGEYEFNKSVAQNAIYASPNGNGNGSKNSPYSLQDGLDSVQKGQTLYLMGGTYFAPKSDGYYIETKGDKDNYVTIRNYPGETPVITNKNTGGESYGFQLGSNVCYTVIEGIEIANITAYNAFGIAVWGNNQNHLIFRNLNIHDVKTNATNPEKETNSSANALLINGENAKPVSNVIIANCNMHDNVTGWAETLSIAGNCEYVYVLENEVHDISNIGIDFYGNAGYCSTASLDQPRYSVAGGNVIYNSYCSYADCAGLYVDGARDILLQYNRVYNCQYGLEVGSEERQDDYPVKNIMVRNNLFYDNSVCGMRVGGYEQVKTGVVYSTVFANNTLHNNATELIIAKVDGITYVNNLIATKKGNFIAKTDFSATYCKNITFTNNYFFADQTAETDYEFEMFGSTLTGLSAFIAKTNATVITGPVSLDDNLKPDVGSIVIDNGVSANYGEYDFNLNARVNGAKVDVGAIEN